MPILVRPVREQLEHDRVIRHLQAKLKRKFDVTTNIGDEKNSGVRAGTLTLYPDLVLISGRKTVGVIEVETTESVNHLEALAQWAHFGRSRIPFSLYVPASAVEIARRLAQESQVVVAEIWSFHAIGDQMRFTLVHRGQVPAHAASPVPAKPAQAKAAPAKAAPAKTARPSPRSAKPRAASRQKASAGRAAASRGARSARRSVASTAAKSAGRTQKRK